VRAQIEHLDTNGMAWQAAGAGVYLKALNAGTDGGARTALVKFVPDEGFAAPSRKHYHSLSEELLVISGLMTFDHVTWLEGGSYCYHPPFVVHGANSAVPETTVLLARGEGELDFNFPEAAEVGAAFDGSKPTRGLLYLNRTQEKDWTPLFDGDGRQIGERLDLGADSVTGAGACFERYFAGWARDESAEGLPLYDEAYVLEGAVTSDTGEVWGEGCYWYRAAGTPMPGVRSAFGALVFRCFG